MRTSHGDDVKAGPKLMRADVYDQLKHRLFTGEIRTGQFVSQRELMALLGATMNPVREAIRKMEAEGLINVYAQRGIQIIEGDPKSINDAYDYRLLLEINAVRHLASRAGADDLGRLEKSVRAVIESISRNPADTAIRRKVLESDYQFHKSIIDFQGNAIFSSHYALNAARLRLFRISMGEPLKRLDLAAQEHLDIVGACMAGDAERAADLLTRHIGISREHTLGIRPMR